ncbi:MAG: flagellar basal body protein [Terricaulis sp.]|jgi:hypothetical protein
MALIADDSKDRAEQLLLISDRLAVLIAEETRRIEAREPLLEGPATEEKSRLANLYRLELARIKQDPALIASAPPTLLTQLKRQTEALQTAFSAHDVALRAVKLISEGLVHAMAEEVVRQRGAGLNYGAKGSLASPSGPSPAILDRSA